ncbi:MAG: DNA mismatch repair endonuclease MutL [Firmicutes bacterium]|nr:DNA mismatch repair endonuclease MutL [Bacillota bacterium]MCM1401759.1 DNA mismatch repair endonuclease MutL [Bacteroides sp.]MCM1476900.1 DNA mismatch repair endonuclease MutL [Bacteroides sp.]
MSDVIRLLPDSVANQIAAGEVIQRPASVIKELVENAVDAGATSIQVIVKDAGRTLIQVVDNGKGMSDTDARMAFERHATSKIERADDLFALHTMGFRGEALASIAAVAQIDLRTMLHGASVGTRILINGSKVESQAPEACAPGTNMMVKNLFFNVPVRRKFLKRDSVELSNILREFERLALVNPSLEFKFINNDTAVHSMIGSSFKQRILDLFGAGLDKQLLPVKTSTPVVKIEGFISRPENARKRNALQYFMVNGRHMRHPYFHKAVMTCFEKLIAADHQPNYFLNFTVDPQSIDVNIHPTKNEIKFENEAPIWQILSAAVREALGKFNAVPGIDFDASDVPDIPVFNPNANGTHSVEIDRSYNPFQQPAHPTHNSWIGGGKNSLRSTGVTSNWEQLYEGFMGDVKSVEASLIPENEMESAPQITEEVATIQLKNHYILSPSSSGVMVIDQHRAHVKVLYESFLDSLKGGQTPSQRIMFPEVLNLTASQSSVLEELNLRLAESGFELSFLGDNSWSIIAQPAILKEASSKETLMQIISDTQNDVPDNGTDKWFGKLALSMAKSVAIKTGQKLSAAEREHLLTELMQLPSPNYTPDGLTIISFIKNEEISVLFS